jgi:hypothetical protein
LVITGALAHLTRNRLKAARKKIVIPASLRDAFWCGMLSRFVVGAVLQAARLIYFQL